MQCKLKQDFVFPLLKFFSAAQTLSLIPLVGTSRNTKRIFFWLSVWDDEVLPTPQITASLAKLLPNGQLSGQLFDSKAMYRFKMKLLCNEEEFFCTKKKLLSFKITLRLAKLVQG